MFAINAPLLLISNTALSGLKIAVFYLLSKSFLYLYRLHPFSQEHLFFVKAIASQPPNLEVEAVM